MELKAIRLEVPEGGNLIVGQTHFIKTVEDLYEAIREHGTADEVRHCVQRGVGACLTQRRS